MWCTYRRVDTRTHHGRAAASRAKEGRGRWATTAGKKLKAAHDKAQREKNRQEAIRKEQAKSQAAREQEEASAIAATEAEDRVKAAEERAKAAEDKAIVAELRRAAVQDSAEWLAAADRANMSVPPTVMRRIRNNGIQ